MRFLLQQQRF